MLRTYNPRSVTEPKCMASARECPPPMAGRSSLAVVPKAARSCPPDPVRPRMRNNAVQDADTG